MKHLKFLVFAIVCAFLWLVPVAHADLVAQILFWVTVALLGTWIVGPESPRPR